MQYAHALTCVYFSIIPTGKPVQVLRSIRHASKTNTELVLHGTLTPSKKCKSSACDVDDLCDMFQAKAKVTPTKKAPGSSKAKKTASLKRTPATRNACKKVDSDDSVKKTLVLTPKTPKAAKVKSTRFSDSTKKPVTTPRRSRRLSGVGGK